jgi:hypothetical protein
MGYSKLKFLRFWLSLKTQYYCWARYNFGYFSYLSNRKSPQHTPFKLPMVTVHISSASDFKILYFVYTHRVSLCVCVFVCVYIFYVIIRTCRLYFPCSITRDILWDVLSEFFIIIFVFFTCNLSRKKCFLSWHVATSCFSFNRPDFHYPSPSPCSKDNQIIKSTAWSKLRGVMPSSCCQ